MLCLNALGFKEQSGRGTGPSLWLWIVALGFPFSKCLSPADFSGKAVGELHDFERYRGGGGGGGREA